MCGWHELLPGRLYEARIHGTNTEIELRFCEYADPLHSFHAETHDRFYTWILDLQESEIPQATARKIRRDYDCWLKHAGQNGLYILRQYAPHATAAWDPRHDIPLMTRLTRKPTEDEMDFFARGLDEFRKGQYFGERLK